MKRRHILFTVISVLLLIVLILPAFFTRISNEAKNNGFTVALEMTNTQKLFKENDFPSVLNSYIESGITTAVIREENGSFNENLISVSKKSGLNIALMLYMGVEKKAGFAEYLDKIIKENDVKYILLKNNLNPKNYDILYKNDPSMLSDIIKKNNTVLVVCETLTQLSNEKPYGYENYIKSANGKVMRCYETYKKTSISDKSFDLTYYQMLNSVYDRNCNFLLVNQLTDGDGDAFQNAARTQRSINKLCNRLTKLGYKQDKEPILSNYNINLRRVSSAAAAISCLMVILMIAMLSKKNHFLLETVIFGASIFIFFGTWFLPMKILLLYPTAFSILAPCFSVVLLLYTADYFHPRLSGFRFTLLIYVFTAASTVFCGIILSSLLSGVDYYINTLIFRGVKLTLTLPILFAATLFFLLEKEQLRLQTTIKNIKIWHIAVVIFAVGAGVIYIRRSGNAQISDFENIFRNLICEIMPARPRTKEFLIGWPSFSLFLYYSYNKKNKFFRFIFLIGTAMLFCSVTNSFCHVFTNTKIIFMRTLNAFIFSVPFVLISIIINYLFNRYIKKNS